MPECPRVLAIGAARVAVINVGDSLWSLAETLSVPESEWRPRFGDAFEQPQPALSQCVHIALPGASLLVDASVYDEPPDGPRRPPAYQPPPALSMQLADLGVAPAEVTHLVITHLHWDHYNGATVERDGAWEPRFPSARCFIGRADWEDPELQAALQSPDSLEARTLGVLWRQGLVELTNGQRELLPGISLIAAPGESPGHQIVRVRSQSETLYCLGDLFHYPVEVEQPTWMSSWSDPAATLASRQALIQAALVEDALLVAAHIPTVGRLRRTRVGVEWAGL
jgi:glyoxylase-like metal-dependent hydrolase (beta-lactamase superfamily II)